jgi:ribosomal protein L31
VELISEKPTAYNSTAIRCVGGFLCEVFMDGCEYGRKICIVRLKRDGIHAETSFPLSAKRTSPFKSAGASVQSTTGSRGVRISVSNAGYTMFRGSVRVLATHSIRHFPLHFPFLASPCAIRFQTRSTSTEFVNSCEDGTNL